MPCAASPVSAWRRIDRQRRMPTNARGARLGGTNHRNHRNPFHVAASSGGQGALDALAGPVHVTPCARQPRRPLAPARQRRTS